MGGHSKAVALSGGRSEPRPGPTYKVFSKLMQRSRGPGNVHAVPPRCLPRGCPGGPAMPTRAGKRHHFLFTSISSPADRGSSWPACTVPSLTHPRPCAGHPHHKLRALEILWCPCRPRVGVPGDRAGWGRVPRGAGMDEGFLQWEGGSGWSCRPTQSTILLVARRPRGYLACRCLLPSSPAEVPKGPREPHIMQRRTGAPPEREGSSEPATSHQPCHPRGHSGAPAVQTGPDYPDGGFTECTAGPVGHVAT